MDFTPVRPVLVPSSSSLHVSVVYSWSMVPRHVRIDKTWILEYRRQCNYPPRWLCIGWTSQLIRFVFVNDSCAHRHCVPSCHHRLTLPPHLSSSIRPIIVNHRHCHETCMYMCLLSVFYQHKHGVITAITWFCVISPPFTIASVVVTPVCHLTPPFVLLLWLCRPDHGMCVNSWWIQLILMDNYHITHWNYNYNRRR